MAGILHEFVQNTKILASQVNENFDVVQGDIEELGNGLNTKFSSEITKAKEDISSDIETVQKNITNLEKRIYITETYSNGASWYRIWSADQTGKKWGEQGGLSDSATTGSSINVSFLKNFADTNYTLCLSSIGTYTKVGESNDTITSKTATGFTVVNGPAQPQRKSWYACGYLA